MLKDITKVLIGVFISEMIFFIWLIARNMLPIDLLGLEFGLVASIIIILTDFTLVILLSYYSWIRKPKEKEELEEEK